METFYPSAAKLSISIKLLVQTLAILSVNNKVYTTFPHAIVIRGQRGQNLLRLFIHINWYNLLASYYTVHCPIGCSVLQITHLLFIEILYVVKRFSKFCFQFIICDNAICDLLLSTLGMG